MQLSELLKEKTTSIHEETEKANLARKIIDHSISLDEYKTLLKQNYCAHFKVHRAAKEYIEESKDASFSLFSIEEKLAQLRMDMGFQKMVIPLLSESEVSINSIAELAGALYVLEGASLGQMLISRHIVQCSSINKSTHFFFADPNRTAILNNWKRFKSELNALYMDDKAKAAMVESAKNTFRAFSQKC